MDANRGTRLMPKLVVCGALLAASVSHADCATMMNDLKTWATGGSSQAVYVTAVSMQGNTIGAAIGSTNGGLARPVLKWDGSYYLTSTASLGSAGQMAFSDRQSGSQPFTISSTESVDMWFDLSGDMYIRDNVWGNWMDVYSGTCVNNVFYGFGGGIGSYPNPAMWVVSFTKGYIFL